MKKYSQRGAAVIVAMLVMTLATTAAVFMAGQQALWFEQVNALNARSESVSLARSGTDWARGILAEDARKNGSTDHLGENWATRLAGMPVESASIGGAIADQQGLFNLNNLLQNDGDSAADMEQFKRLLEELKLPPDLVNAVLDWIDADGTAHYPGGAEDSDYLLGDHPYRAANRLLVSVEELYRVRGFNEKMIARLRPFVTALPGRTPINVNTAPPQVLLALLPGYAMSEVESLVDKREEAHFKDKEDFAARLPRPLPGLNKEAFDVKSSYFLATVMVQTDRMETAYATLLSRPAGGGWPTVLWQQAITD